MNKQILILMWMSIYTFSLSASLLLGSHINEGSIASNDATYDGSVLILDGDVSLKHGFGIMQADKAVLARQLQSQEEFPFASIELAEKVHLKLKTEAEVECERASLDFSTMEGKLTSTTRVHFTDRLHSTPYELFTPQLDLQLIKNVQDPEVYEIKQAQAHKGVHLIYNKLYHLQTESVTFASNQINSDGQGCTWSCGDDKVQAEKFILDLTHNHLFLQKDVVGHLNSFTKGVVEFQSDTLDWKHRENHLALKGSSSVKESTLGALTSDQSMDLFLKEKKLNQIQTAGMTRLTSIKGHTLLCQGTMTIDGDKKLGTIQPDRTQLIYQEEEMTLKANRAQMHYHEDEKGMHPERLELEGEIKIFSQDQRGMADFVTYHPATRKCILKALAGHKVLFMRDKDQLRISADEVHITYNPLTKEQEVRGVGRIAMSLSPDEQKLLNQVFRHESTAP